MTSAPATSPWFVRPPSAERRARIFCFPYSGAGASAFSAWPAEIDRSEVCPLQFPGRENRLAEPHYGTFEKLTAALVDALAPRLDGPYAFFGHCAGALLAYETVVLLAERGLPGPGRLVVSGQAPPHEAWRDRMLTMTEPELRAELTAVMRTRGIEPRPDMIDMGLAVLLSDLAAARGYQRVEPVVVGCPILVLHWRDDPELTLDQLQGWRRYSAEVDFHVVDGGRHDFADPPGAWASMLTRGQ